VVLWTSAYELMILLYNNGTVVIGIGDLWHLQGNEFFLEAIVKDKTPNNDTPCEFI